MKTGLTCPWSIGLYPIKIKISGVTAGGRGVPPTLLTRKFLLTYREKRGEEKGKMERKKRRRKIEKGKGWKIENGKRERYQMRREPFFVFCFGFSLFKTTEICLGSTKMGTSTGKKSGKMTLPPLKNIPLTPLIKIHIPLVCPWQSLW